MGRILIMKQLEQKFVEADGRRLKPNKEIRGTMWNCTSKVGKIGAPWTFLAITPSFLILGGSNFHHMFTTLWGMF